MDGLVLWIIVGLATVAVLGIGGALWDLRRSEVRHLPKWAWALVIALVSFPIGAILYLVVGRVPRDESATTSSPGVGADLPPAADPVHTAGSASLAAAAVATTRTAPASEVADLTGDAVISTSGVGKVYGDAVALEDVDLVVPRGATYGLIGPNGAGKTTMLSILAGLRRPTTGEVHLGVERRRIASLVDTPLFEPWLTAREVVDLARHLVAADLSKDRVDAALTEVGLADAADRRTGGFSRGMLQRLGLATCLVGDPDVLLLDEPSSALDPAGRREVLDLIGQLSRTTTVVLSTHILGDVQQVCDIVGVIDHGHLRYQGPIQQLLARTSAAYAVHVRPTATELLTDLKAQPWVETVEELAPGRLRLVTTDAPAAEQQIPRLVTEHGLSLVSFYPATDLETAFLELTR
jgi:ABC-2 type transport system ATP-binding protein